MTRYLLLALTLTLASAARAQQTSPMTSSQVLFNVGKTPVRSDEFVYLFRKNHSKREDFTDLKIEEYFNLMVHFKLKVAEARSRGLDTTKAFQKELKSYKDELRKPYVTDSDDLEKLTREAYGRLAMEVKAAHILIAVKSDASPEDTLVAYRKIEVIRQRLVKGESFEDLARQYSEDPSAKTNSGLLGYFTALQMVYSFEQEAYRTAPGELSHIVRTRFGYHLIKVYDRRPAQGEVEISHILLRSSKDGEKKLRDKAFSIYDQLRAGRPWDELCKEYSEDNNTKSSGGRLRPFSTGAFASIPEFEKTAFAMKNPGEFSDPFESSYGWHIIRLEKKISLPTYQEMESSLRKRVARDERTTIARGIALDKKKQKYGMQENQLIKIELLSMADSSLLKGVWKYRGPDSLLNKILIVLGGTPSPVIEWADFVQSQQTRSSLSPSAYLKQLHDRFVDLKIGAYEEQILMKENPDYRMLSTEYEEGILLFEIMEKEVWNRASSDSVGQQKFYHHHLASFKAGTRVEARIFSLSGKEAAEDLMRRLSGDSITKSETSKLKAVTSWKIYDHQESQLVDQISWVPGIQTLEQKGTWYAIEIRRLVAPGTKTFEEARAAVITGFQDELEKQWIAKLKRKFPVRINKKSKFDVMAALKQ